MLRALQGTWTKHAWSRAVQLPVVKTVVLCFSKAGDCKEAYTPKPQCSPLVLGRKPVVIIDKTGQ